MEGPWNFFRKGYWVIKYLALWSPELQLFFKKKIAPPFYILNASSLTQKNMCQYLLFWWRFFFHNIQFKTFPKENNAMESYVLTSNTQNSSFFSHFFWHLYCCLWSIWKYLKHFLDKRKYKMVNGLFNSLYVMLCTVCYHF